MPIQPKTTIAIFLACSLFVAGCTSTSSTLTTRTADDQLVGNSNGRNGLGQQANPYKGIPVTMRVPTHLDVSVIESVYLSQTGDDYSQVELPNRHLELQHAIVYSDKIITVDPKRPAAGTLKYSATFQSDNAEARDRQFFSKIDYDVDDKTIKTITALIPTLFPAKPSAARVVNPTSAGETKIISSDPKLVVKKRTVAWKRFDINAPAFEQELSDFVAQHVNCDAGCVAPECRN